MEAARAKKQLSACPGAHDFHKAWREKLAKRMYGQSCDNLSQWARSPCHCLGSGRRRLRAALWEEP